MLKTKQQSSATVDYYLPIVETTPEFILEFKRLAHDDITDIKYSLCIEHPWQDQYTPIYTIIEFSDTLSEPKIITIADLNSATLTVYANGLLEINADLPRNCAYDITTTHDLIINKLITDFDVYLECLGKLTINHSLLSQGYINLSSGEFDNRQGKIYSRDGTSIKVTGDLHHGAPQEVDHTYDILGMAVQSKWQAFNGSFIHSLGPIEISAAKLYHQYSTIRSESNLILDITGEIHNLSAEIESAGDINVSAESMLHETKITTSNLLINRTNTPYSAKKVSIDYVSSQRASLKAGGKLNFKVQNITNKGGSIYSSGGTEFIQGSIDNQIVILRCCELPYTSAPTIEWLSTSMSNTPQMNEFCERMSLREIKIICSTPSGEPHPILVLDTIQGSIISAVKVDIHADQAQLGNLNLAAPEINIRDFAALVHGIIDQSIILPPPKPFRQEISLAEMPFNAGLYEETKPGESLYVYALCATQKKSLETLLEYTVYAADNTVDNNNKTLRRLFSDELEQRLLLDALMNSINRGNLTAENTTAQQVLCELRANAQAYRTSGKPLTAAEFAMVFYRVEEYTGSHGTEKVLVPKLYLPEKLNKPELRSAAGIIEAEIIRILSSKEASYLMLTSYLDATNEIHLKADTVELERRKSVLIQFKQTMIRRKRRPFGGSKTTLQVTRVETSTPAPGGELRSGGNIKVEAKHLHTKGVQFESGADIDLIAESSIKREPIVAARIVQHQAKAKSILEKVEINQDLVKYGIYPTTLNAQGNIRVRVENGNIIDIAVQEHGKNHKHEARNGILDQRPCVQKQDLPIVPKRRGMKLEVLDGQEEIAEPQRLFADGKIELSAKEILLCGVEFSAEEIYLHSVKGTTITCQILNHVLRNRVNGIEGFTYIDAKSETKFQTGMQTIMSGFKVLEIIADQGEINIESILLAGAEGAKFYAQAKDNAIKFTTVKLEASTKTKKRTIGVNFTGADAILSALKGDIKGVAKALIGEVPFLAPLCNLSDGGHVEDYMAQAMLLHIKLQEANDNGQFGNPSSTMGAITDCYGLQKDAAGKYTWNPNALAPKIRLGKMRAETYSTEVIPSIINVWHTIFQAARDIELHSIYIDGKTLLVNAGGSIVIVADEEVMRAHETNQGVTVGLKGANPGVGLDLAHDEQYAKSYKTSVLQLEDSINLIAKDSIQIRGAVLETAQAFLKANTILIETVLNEERRRLESIAANMDGNINFGVKNAHSKWSKVQSKIFASNSLYISASNEVQIKGGALHVGNNATPIITSDGQQLYRIGLPRDGDDLFHALGVSRIKAANDLLDKSNDNEYRAIVAIDIARLLRSNQLPKIMANHPEIKRLYDLHNVDSPSADILDQILQYCTNEEVYRDFITFYVGLEGSNIDFNVANPQQLGVIDAIAKLYNFKINAWSKDEQGVLHVLHKYDASSTGRQIDLLLNIQLVNDQHTYSFNLLSPDPMVLLTPVVTYEHLRGFKTGNGFGLNGNGLLDLLGNANDADKNAARPYVVGTMFREDQEQQNNAAILNEVLELEKAHAINPIDGKRHSIDGVKVDPEQAKVDGKKHRCGFGFAVAMPDKVRDLSRKKSSEEDIVIVSAENSIQEEELIVEDVAPKENSTTENKRENKKTILAIREFIDVLENKLGRNLTPQEKSDIWEQLYVIKDPIVDRFGRHRYIVALKNGVLDIGGHRVFSEANIHHVFADFAKLGGRALNVNGGVVELPWVDELNIGKKVVRGTVAGVKYLGETLLSFGGRLAWGIVLVMWPRPLEESDEGSRFNNLEVEAQNYVPVFIAPLVPVKPPKVPNKMVNPVLKPGEVDNGRLVQPIFEGDVVGNIEGQRLDQKPLDASVPFTPRFDGDRVQNMYKRDKGDERKHAPRAIYDEPLTLEGYDKVGLYEAKRKTPVQGGGKLRKRWKDKKGLIYEWDYQEGHVELYNKRGEHLGAFDPKSAKILKPRNKTRRVEP